MKHLRLLTLLLVALIAAPVGAQTLPDTAPLDAFVRAEMERLNVPGAALAIVEGDAITYVQGYGDRNAAGDPVTGETQFFIGSASKSFTALAVMQLVEAGAVGLDDPVAAYLPWFTYEAITVRHLLNQTSGYTTRTGLRADTNTDQRDTALAESVRALHTDPLAHEPGTAYAYSNLNYNILGLIVQEVTGLSYEAVITQRIFEPLGMTGSTARPDFSVALGAEPRIEQMTAGHRYWFGLARPAPDLFAPRAMTPSSYLISTPADMARYLLAHQNGGAGDRQRVLSEAGIALLHEPAADTGTGGSYAMGWVVEPFGPAEEALWHAGDTPHFNTTMVLLPEHDLGFMLLMNANSTARAASLHEVAARLTALLLDETPAEPVPGPLGAAIRGTLGVLLVGQLAWIAGSVMLLQRWQERGTAANPVQGGLPRRGDAAFALLGLRGVPALFGIPLAIIGRYGPTEGVLIFAAAGLAVVWGAARSVLALNTQSQAKGIA
ncbi:MAG: serine hydrolase domain-containing protein [Anaerolineae bacterium]